MDGRHISPHLLSPIGEKLLPESPNTARLDIIFNNLASMVNRIHPGFSDQWPMPQNMTRAQMGENFRHRIFLKNEFDTVEGVRFDGLNYNNLPNLRARQGWISVSFDDIQATGNAIIKEIYSYVT